MDSLTPKQEDYLLEMARDEVQCEFCHKFYSSTELDLVTIPDGKNMWCCHSCWEVMERVRDKDLDVDLEVYYD